MTFTFCTYEVRVKLTSFQKVTLFLLYEIFHRDVIRLHFCLFYDVNDCCNIKKNRIQKVLLHSESSFLLRNTIKTNTIGSLVIEIKLKACNLHTNFAMLCTLYYLRQSIEIFSDYSLPLDVTVLLCKLKKKKIKWPSN